MGSGISVHTIEVSFVNTKTGQIYPEEQITEISNKICKEFDYKPSFYEAYKRDRHGNNPYKIYASDLENGFIK